MVKTLEALEEDPRKWANPPQNEEDVEYANKFRKSAIAYFQARPDYTRLMNKYGKDYMEKEYWFLKTYF